MSTALKITTFSIIHAFRSVQTTTSLIRLSANVYNAPLAVRVVSALGWIHALFVVYWLTLPSIICKSETTHADLYAILENTLIR